MLMIFMRCYASDIKYRLFFHHFLQEGMEQSCFVHELSFFIHVMSVCSGTFMVGTVQIVVLSVIVYVCVYTHIWKACAASINMVTESRVRNAA
jgi:hypothetical protein